MTDPELLEELRREFREDMILFAKMYGSVCAVVTAAMAVMTVILGDPGAIIAALLADAISAVALAFVWLTGRYIHRDDA